MSDLTFTCPACMTSQLPYPNVMSPAPVTGVFVACPDCEAVAVHHPRPADARKLRTWAAVSAEVDVQLFRRRLDRGVSA